MQTTSQLYKDILAEQNHWFEYRLEIDGTSYGEGVVRSLRTNLNMLKDKPEIGTAVAGEIDVEMQSVEIPFMAELRPYVRACSKTAQSEWLPQGVFYCDTRQRSKDTSTNSVVTIHGYDAMMKAEQMYSGNITGDSTDIEMVEEIASIMGVEVDPRTRQMVSEGYTIPFASGYTLREILGYIASMYIGSFIMSDEGKLRLVSLLELPPETNYLITENADAITFGGVRILV